MIEFIIAMATTWLFFAVPAVLLALPVWFLGKRRTQWSGFDALVFVIPWAVWVTLFTFGPRDASLSSAVVESVILGCLAPLALILRVIGGDKWNSKYTRIIGFAAVSIIGIALWAFVPFIGE
jgi:hypothetical protein